MQLALTNKWHEPFGVGMKWHGFPDRYQQFNNTSIITATMFKLQFFYSSLVTTVEVLDQLHKKWDPNAMYRMNMINAKMQHLKTAWDDHYTVYFCNWYNWGGGNEKFKQGCVAYQIAQPNKHIDSILCYCKHNHKPTIKLKWFEFQEQIWNKIFTFI